MPSSEEESVSSPSPAASASCGCVTAMEGGEPRSCGWDCAGVSFGSLSSAGPSRLPEAEEAAARAWAWACWACCECRARRAANCRRAREGGRFRGGGAGGGSVGGDVEEVGLKAERAESGEEVVGSCGMAGQRLLEHRSFGVVDEGSGREGWGFHKIRWL